MSFTSIVFKNLKYNFSKFMSYIFVNMFVISILFTYGSILFNKNITSDPLLSNTMDFVYFGIIAIVLFCIVFISYTGVYFVKARGKELGVYLTLGMTKNDLIKMMILENTSIMLVSVIGGIFSGTIFSGLFYLILSKVLDSDNLFYLSTNTFLLSLGVFFIVFISNILFSIIFIKRTDIVKITKSTKTKGMKTPKKILGFLGITLFIVSTTLLYLMFSDKSIVKGLSNKATEVIFISVSVQFISLYFMISSGLNYIVSVLSKNKKFYNKHIIILSNIKYTFYTYKTTLYIITILTGMSILFMGIQLSFNTGTKKIMDTVLPYDFMIESSNNVNNISKDEIEKIVKDNNGEISDFIDYQYVSTEIYRENSTWLYNFGTTTMIVSESNFNNAFDTKINVNKDELLMVNNFDEDFSETKIDYDTFLVVDNYNSGEERANKIRKIRPSRDEFYDIVKNDNVETLTYEKENVKAMYYPFINSNGIMEFESVLVNIVDDEVYNDFLNPEITEVNLFNLKKGDELKINDDLTNKLEAVNKTANKTNIKQRGYSQICKELKEEETNKMLGMFSFTMTFISILFLISSSVVMYYKLVNDVDYEREQIKLFKKIGINSNECRNYITKHTAIIFFTPLLIGGIIGLFYNYFFLYNAPMRSYLLSRVLIMYFGFVIFNIVFYIIIRRSMIKNVNA